MRYLRAIISSDTRGVLYKKDFKVQNVFDIFVRSFVSTLISERYLKEGEFYSALIIPRYGQFQPATTKITAHGIVKEGEKRSWIALEFEDPIDAEKPVDFFTLDLFVVRQARSYRSNLQLTMIDYFWLGIEKAMEQVGALRYKEQMQRKLYVRDDDQGDFEHEEIQTLQQDVDSLIRIVPGEHTVPSFPQKLLTDFTLESTRKLLHGKLVEDTPDHADNTGTADQSGVSILIDRSTLESLQQIARSDVRVEQGGVLVGSVYEDAASSNRAYIVEITAHIPAEETFANEVELRYTFESWQRQTSLLKERFPEKRIVGWYHTHLDLVKRTYYIDESHQSTYTTPIFFSQDDHFTHKQFFREKWHVAMVLDPEGHLTFFQWERAKIKESRKFYVIASKKDT